MKNTNTYSKEQVGQIEKYLFEIENNYLNPIGKFKKIREILSAPVSEPKNQFGEVRVEELRKKYLLKFGEGNNHFDWFVKKFNLFVLPNTTDLESHSSVSTKKA